MARLPVSGSDSGVWGNLNNEFLSVGHYADGTLKRSSAGPERINLVAPPSRLAIEILADTPKGYWQCNDPVGQATVLDSSGLSHNGTAGSSVKFGGLGLGNFPGKSIWTDRPTSNGKVTVSSHADFNVADVFSLEASLRIPRDFIDISGGAPGFFGADTSGGPYLACASGKIRLAKNGGATLVDSTLTITDTHLWYHIIVTKTGSTVKIWVNNTDVTGTVTNSTFSAQSQAMFLMNDFGRFQVAHAAIYNTALNSTRVGAHYAAFQHDNKMADKPVAIGVHTDSMYNGNANYPASQAATMKNIKAKMSRFTVLWEQVQASSGASYDWSKLDEIVRTCNLNNVTPLFMLGSSPTWANGGTGRYDIPGVGADTTFKQFTGKFSTFVADFIDRYKPGGAGPYTVAEMWCEIWNEENITGFWNNLSANTNQQWADAYAYLYKTIRGTVLDRHSTARVIFGGLSSWGAVGGSSQTGEGFLRLVIGSSQWTNTYIDYMGYHPYPNSNNPDDTTSFSNHFNDVMIVKDVLAELSYPYTPVCITEFGISDSTSQADQATKLTTTINRVLNEWSSFVPLTIWFDLSDDIAANYGLFTSMPTDGTPSVATKTASANFTAAAIQPDRIITQTKPKLDPGTATAASVTSALLAAGIVDKATGSTNNGNLKENGAVGDGVADDSAAFLKTLATLPTGAKLYIPAGTYNLALATQADIPSNTVVHGDGAASVLVFNSTNSNGTLRVPSGNSNVTFRDISLKRGNTTAGRLLDIHGKTIVTNCLINGNSVAGTAISIGSSGDGTMITDNNFVDVSGLCVSGIGAGDIRIVNNSMRNCLGSTAVISVVETGTMNNIEVLGNHIYSNASATPIPILIDTASSGVLNNVRINDNYVETCNFAIELQFTGGSTPSPSKATISNNTIKMIASPSGFGGISIAADGVAITGNVIDANSIVIANGIEVATSNFCTVTGNIIYGDAAVSNGIVLNASSHCTVTGNVINGIKNASGAFGIYLTCQAAHNTNDNVINGNHIFNPNGTNNGRGIVIDTNDASDHADRNVIVGNAIYGNNISGSRGIALDNAGAGTIDKTVVGMNIMRNLAGGILQNADTNTLLSGTTWNQT